MTLLLFVFGGLLLLHAWRITTSSRSASHKALVLLGNVLYGLALAAFLFPPTTSAPARTMAVLTPGATPADIRQATRAAQAVAIGEIELDNRERRRITVVPDVAAARAQAPDTNLWRVLGAGLPAKSPIDAVAIEFAASAPPAGVRDAHWPQQLKPGDTFTVNGSVTSSVANGTTVALLDPSGEVAATANTDTEGQFTLSAQTKAAGGVLFALQVRADDERVIEQVPLPVDIRQPDALRILVRAAAPSFEIRYLKDWARRGGASMVIDTTISRDRQRREYVNHDDLAGTRLSAPLLSNFDLVILDARALEALEPAERVALSSAVARSGLGAIIIGAAEGPSINGYRQPATIDVAATDVAVALPGASGTQVGVGAQFSNIEGEVVLRALTGEPLAQRLPVEDNAWVTTLVESSHRWITAGQPDTHAAYWNTLIDAALPPRTPITVTTSPPMPYAQQQTLLCVRGTDSDTVELVSDDATALQPGLSSVANRPGERCALIYPVAGWHSMRVDARNVARLYVLGANEWSVRQQWLASQSTERLAAIEAAPTTAQTSAIAWSRWPFAVVSLLLASALWFEQRRLSA